jgi:hypothetical protein
MRVRTGLSEFAILFDIARRIASQPKTGQNQSETPSHRRGVGRATPQFKQIKACGDKTQWDTDAPGNTLPAGDPILLRLCCGIIHLAASE